MLTRSSLALAKCSRLQSYASSMQGNVCERSTLKSMNGLNIIIVKQ